MPSPLRLRLAWLRLALLFSLGCFLILYAGLLGRAAREQSRAAESQTHPPDFPFLGITLIPDGLAPDALEQELARLADAGFGWVRVRLAWDEIEPQPGQWQWSAADTLLDAIRRAGLEPVLLLDGSPAWARAPADQLASTGHLAPPADFNTFADFATAVATRYGGHARTYQVWDEPNISPHWGARHIEATAYARLLKATAPALRAADPGARILLAALAPTADRGHTAQDEVYFLQRLYAAGAAPFFDAVALQPFGFGTTPQDTRRQRAVLNLHRALLVRRAMVAAGDGATPVWLVRTGWNRALASPWGTVTPRRQIDFATTMLALVYDEWPWVAALGWADHAPALSPGEPAAGFSLTPALAQAFRAWSEDAALRPRGQTVRAAPLWPLVGRAIIWAAAVALWAWRTRAAARLLPWADLRRGYRALPSSARIVLWAALLATYRLATWPPLIALCWTVAALLLTAQPVMGLGLALAVLPFHAQHKELQLVDGVWAIPPAYAALMCTLPALWQSRRKARAATLYSRHSVIPRSLRRGISPEHQRREIPRPGALWARNDNSPLKFVHITAPTDRGWGLAATWLLAALLGAWHVWHWPAYYRGMLELVLAPLLLFSLIRAWPPARRHLPLLAGALWMGGLLMALAGLASWLRGAGTSADGLLRLVGPTFSPNHTALYLERSLFLGMGLGLAAQGRTRLGLWAANSLIALALLLTGSRGALLLGLPAGALVLLLLRPHLPSRVRKIAWGGLLAAMLIAALAAGALAWMQAPRLANWATVSERWESWRLTLALWRDHWLVGLGPGGFYWRFPAYLPVNSRVDPNLRHPHMIWLELAAQGGILGLVWLAAALALTTHWLATRRAQLAWPQVGLAAGLAAGLAHGQVDAFQALPDLAAWNWAALALLLTWPTLSPQQNTAAPKDSGIDPANL